MKLMGGVAVAVLAAAVAAVPAQAASTRAEYVAQVDPICQSSIAPAKKAGKKYVRSVKKLARQVRGGSDPKKALKGVFKRAAGLLGQINKIVANETAQISEVPPPPADQGAVSLWLQNRTAYKQFTDAAIRALRHFKLRAFARNAAQASAALEEGHFFISGFGFNHCV
jgi:hypothetical protein